ncbi:MAG: hypothetical protein Q9M13_04980, partial [Mariprofundales bacterium]|nr:hypothetical protein [Mariprofundales bacterium]
MTDIRVIELAKILKVDVGDVQRAAQACRVTISGPTSPLNSEDRRRIEQTIRQKGGANRSVSRDEGSTLTLKRPISIGGRAGSDAVGGQGHTVKVEVRRRRHRPVLQAPGRAAATSTSTPVAKVKSAKQAQPVPSPQAAPSQAVERSHPAGKRGEQQGSAERSPSPQRSSVNSRSSA